MTTQPDQGETTPTMWVIRAGTGGMGEADSLFLRHALVVLGDQGMSDLSGLAPDREAFYRMYQESHPRETKGIAGIGGKFFRFVHEMATGDIVLYPSLKDGKLYIGTVEGPYVYDRSPDPKYPHHRSVKWEFVLPRKELTVWARRELGAARTLFRLKSNDKEIRAKMRAGKLAHFTPPGGE